MNDTDLLSQTEHLSDIFTRIMLRTLAGTSSDEITIAQFQALRHVSQHGPCTVGSLAEGLSVSQPAATMLIDRMARRGLVDRQTGKSDRRQAEVSLTRHARSLLDRIEAERAEHLSKILDMMSRSEREQFVELLERFVSAALRLECAVDEACLRCGIGHHTDCVVNQMHLERVGTDVERV